jgi:hypothetical protein
MAVLYGGFGIKERLPVVILPYILGVLANILLMPVHNKPYITYIVLISITFTELLALIMITGGIMSPILLIVIILPVFAFYTSRKQGKIWFVICFLAVLFVYNLNRFNIPVTDIISPQYHATMYFIVMLIVLVLTSVYLMLVKQDISRAHKSFGAAKKDLEEKNKSMENLIMLVNYSAELMCVIDQATLTFDEVNPVYKVLLGYELSELRGAKAGMILKDEVLPKLSTMGDDEVTSFDCKVLCRNGEEKVFNWLVTAKKGKLYTYGRNVAK